MSSRRLPPVHDHGTVARASGDDFAPFLICPRCGLTIRPKASWPALRHCPRCLARSHAAVDMFASTMPAASLYDEAPDAGDQSLPQAS